MSSWFSELAGKAENILTKIDQNAANVLKTDANDRDQLLEVKTSNFVETSINRRSEIKRNLSSSNSLKLPRTPRKFASISPDGKSVQFDELEQSESKFMNAHEDVAVNSFSNASNSSRRSSWSSKTEGIQTVIEYPMENSTAHGVTNGNGNTMHASTSSTSLKIAAEEKTELLATKIVLNQVKSEKDQLKAEITDLKNQLITTQSKDIIAELSNTIDQLTSDRDQMQQKIFELETSNSDSSKAVSDLEVTIAKLHQIEMDLNEKLSWAKSEAEHATADFQQYRARAQNTLQMKDDIIAQLKSLHTKSSSEELTELDSYVKQIEWTKMKEQHDALVTEINMLREQLSESKRIIGSLEAKCHDLEVQMGENEKSTTQAMKQERIRYSQLEETLRTQTKEISAVRDELRRAHTTSSIKLHEKENELSKLRTKLSQRSVASSSIVSNSMDDRVYSLTQSLVHKQNALETMTADRNAIRLQLEQLENQHRETMQLLRKQRLPQIINVNDTDDAKSMVPKFMQENPFDTHVARRMKRAYSSLDAAGVRLGVFLRRYPVVRTMVIVYVAILHLWVMFVLLSSTPN